MMAETLASIADHVYAVLLAAAWLWGAGVIVSTAVRFFIETRK